MTMTLKTFHGGRSSSPRSYIAPCSNLPKNPPKESVTKLATTMSPLRAKAAKASNTRILLGGAYVEAALKTPDEILPPPRPLPNSSDYNTERLQEGLK